MSNGLKKPILKTFSTVVTSTLAKLNSQFLVQWNFEKKRCVEKDGFEERHLPKTEPMYT